MTDYRPLLSKIVRLADRGTFSLSERLFVANFTPSYARSHRWIAQAADSNGWQQAYGRDPGVAVRRLLAVLEKGRRDG